MLQGYYKGDAFLRHHRLNLKHMFFHISANYKGTQQSKQQHFTILFYVVPHSLANVADSVIVSNICLMMNTDSLECLTSA